MTFNAPNRADLAAVEALLTAADLPTQGLEFILHNFLVVRDERGQIAACAGIERYSDTGLLRSVAVAVAYRGTGLGTEIVRAVIEKSASEGVKELVLLTTTARDFFADKFGFVITSRDRFGETFDGSWEWGLSRCSTAVVMARDLTK
jgi:amino-acid N-acetyltransferase